VFEGKGHRVSMNKQRLIKLTIVFGALIFLGMIGLWKLSSLRSFQFFGKMIAQVETAQKRVALSFDDGPTPEYTEEVLKVLAASNVKATFFVTGAETEKNLAEAKKIVQAGHELGNHSYSHTRMIFKTPRFVAKEIEDTDAAIRAAGWQGPILFRPPYGKRLFVLPWYLAQNNRITAMWDLEPESNSEIVKNPKVLANYVIEQAKPGSIILLHLMYPSRESSRQALPLIIKGLKAKGFQFLTIAELLKQG
jgi:peptidoglycan-N-acetylglucosamine deacetylase